MTFKTSRLQEECILAISERHKVKKSKVLHMILDSAFEHILDAANRKNKEDTIRQIDILFDNICNNNNDQTIYELVSGV